MSKLHIEIVEVANGYMVMPSPQPGMDYPTPSQTFLFSTTEELLNHLFQLLRKGEDDG